MFRRKYEIVFAFTLAVSIRLFALLIFAGSPFARVMIGDSKGYLETAAGIASGDVGVFFQSAPLYTVVLALTRLFSEHPWLPVTLVQIAMSGLACAAIATASGVVFPHYRSAPWIAGAISAIYGPSIYFDLEVLPASLALSLSALGLSLALRSGAWPRSLCVGLLVGAATLLAPALILVAAAIALWTALGPRGRPDRSSSMSAAAVLLGAGVVIAPVTIHNGLAGDRVLISSNAGVNAFIGNNSEATGAFFLPPTSGLDGARLERSARLVAENAAGRRLEPSEVSSYWMSRARDFATSEPGRFLRLLGRKTLLTVNHYEIPNHLNYQFVTERFLPGLRLALPFWILFPLFGLGALAVVDLRSRAGLLVLGAALLCLVVPILFFATARYRLPAASAMLILAGGGPAWLSAGIIRRRWARAAAAVLLVAGLAWVTRLHLVREHDYSFDHLLLGDAYWKLGQLDESIVEFKLSIETAPFDHGARVWLARVLEERGNALEAATALERHLETRPEDANAWALLARLRSAEPRPPGPQIPSTDYEIALGYLGRRDLDDAEQALRRAIERDPTHVRAMIELAYVRTRFDDLLGAFAWLERAVRLAPSDPEIWKDLARIYDRAGHTDAARQSIERAIELDPTDAELRRVLELLDES